MRRALIVALLIIKIMIMMDIRMKLIRRTNLSLALARHGPLRGLGQQQTSVTPTIMEKGRAVANPRRDGPEDPDPESRNGRLITGQVENGECLRLLHLYIEPKTQAVHTASDIPLTASGPGAWQFVGVQDNTSVFFKMMRAFGIISASLLRRSERPVSLIMKRTAALQSHLA